MEKSLQQEKEIFDSIGIDTKYYSQQFEYLEDGTRVHTVHFSKVPRTKDNVLVMVHGYFSSNVSSFKLNKVLMDNFYIISVDLPGFGLSTNQKADELDSNQKWVDYFNNCKTLYFILFIHF